MPWEPAPQPRGLEGRERFSAEPPASSKLSGSGSTASWSSTRWSDPELPCHLKCAANPCLEEPDAGKPYVRIRGPASNRPGLPDFAGRDQPRHGLSLGIRHRVQRHLRSAGHLPALTEPTPCAVLYRGGGRLSFFLDGRCYGGPAFTQVRPEPHAKDGTPDAKRRQP